MKITADDNRRFSGKTKRRDSTILDESRHRNRDDVKMNKDIVLEFLPIYNMERRVDETADGASLRCVYKDDA